MISKLFKKTSPETCERRGVAMFAVGALLTVVSNCAPIPVTHYVVPVDSGASPLPPVSVYVDPFYGYIPGVDYPYGDWGGYYYGDRHRHDGHYRDRGRSPYYQSPHYGDPRRPDRQPPRFDNHRNDRR